MIVYSFYKKVFFISMLIFIILFPTKIYAEDDFAFFDENWAINLFLKYNMAIFSDLNHSEYRTNKPFDIGIGFRYKNISTRIFMPLILDDFGDIWAFDFEIDSYFDNIFYEAYFKHYPYFYIGDSDIQSELSIHSSGIMATFVHNHKNHSLTSVTTLDRKQNISSGSLLYGFGVFHSSLYSIDENILKYDARQHLLYFGPSIGYSYTWVFRYGVFLNSSLVFFANPGINISTGNWLFIPQFEPKIVVGHYNNTWSANLIMKNNAKFIIWNKDDIDILTLVSITLMFSKRL